jgi:hypothetical protein
MWDEIVREIKRAIESFARIVGEYGLGLFTVKQNSFTQCVHDHAAIFAIAQVLFDFRAQIIGRIAIEVRGQIAQQMFAIVMCHPQSFLFA